MHLWEHKHLVSVPSLLFHFLIGVWGGSNNAHHMGLLQEDPIYVPKAPRIVPGS